MADSDVKEFQWNRKIARGWGVEPGEFDVRYRLLAKVSSFEKQDKSLLDMFKPEILFGNRRDVFALKGQVVGGDEKSMNQKFILLVPEYATLRVAANEYLAMGIAKNDVCVSFEIVPGELSLADKLKWLQKLK